MLDLNHLKKYRENNRIEAKKALGGLPESLWETYSAFANTVGGIILLGVEEYPDKSLHAVDLSSPEKLVAEFYEILNDKRRVSANILGKRDVKVELAEGKHIILINVPRAQRAARPVFIDGDPYTGTYRRDGEGDRRCKREEVECMLKRRDLGRTEFEKAEILRYLTDNVRADSKTLAALLAAPLPRARRLLNELERERLIVHDGSRPKIFRLKD